MKALFHLAALLSITSALTVTSRQEEGDGTAFRTVGQGGGESRQFDISHVIAASKKVTAGRVSDDSIKRQLNVMNQSFKGRNFQFHHAGTTRTVNKDLAVIQPGERIVKLGNKFRKGDYATLNLYIVKDLPANTAGDCSLPSQNPGSECKKMDTCANKKGTDPIHNYMNYTPTSCWTGFTDGQGKRMHSFWNVRKSKN